MIVAISPDKVNSVAAAITNDTSVSFDSFFISLAPSFPV